MKESIPLQLITGVGSVLTGLLYLLQVFGPTETEIVTWGKTAILAGIVLCALALVAQLTHPQPIITLSLLVDLMLIALLQILPIYLWLVSHGSVISDGSPPDAFMAHWIFALPHSVLLILSLIILVRLSRWHQTVSNHQQTFKRTSNGFRNEP
ncbi:MAG TPA: hypothetical protein VFD54_02260 [Anaerolineales bacterium]|jgi:hypothetical protein|nr:hypothetical protein [Anaerolineales bacterium]